MHLIPDSLKGIRPLLLSATALMLAACSDPSFKIKGEIYGAGGQSIVVEKPDFHGNWIAVDSTRISKSGSFSISMPSPAAPEIYRLSIGKDFIYLPVDSTETVTVNSSAERFGSDYTLSGSDNARALAMFDKEFAALPASAGVDSLDSFKRRVFAEYMKDRLSSVVSYYILTKVKEGRPLFDPDRDRKYFAAVATGFKHERPSDPRAALLEKTAVEAMRKHNEGLPPQYIIEAEELKVIDIELPDEQGKLRRLSDMVGKGKNTVVMFTVLTHPDAPATHIELKKIHDRFASSAEFYQVSLDPDQYAWREAARNLPWTTVFDPDGEYSKAARSYNVGAVPVFFIYNRNGELTSRASTLDELAKQLSSL